MARDERFKTDNNIFISAVTRIDSWGQYVSHILLRTGKILHKRTDGTKTNCHKSGKPNNAEKTPKEKFKVPYARKNEDTKIPSEKVTLSSAEMANAMEQENTLLEKSVVVSNEEKRSADNVIPINILNRPSPIQEYRYNMFERSSRPLWNQVRDSRGNSTTFYSNLFHIKRMISTPI